MKSFKIVSSCATYFIHVEVPKEVDECDKFSGLCSNFFVHIFLPFC